MSCSESFTPAQAFEFRGIPSSWVQPLSEVADEVSPRCTLQALQAALFWPLLPSCCAPAAHPVVIHA